MNFDDVYKTMLLKRGGSVKNSDIKNSKDSINRQFQNDPSYKLGKLKKRNNLNDELDLDTRLVNNDNNPLEKKIYLRPDTNIEVGDYIIYPDITYLVLAVETNLISPRADSTKCNQFLKWMYNGNLFETQAIVTNQTKYTLGMDVLVSGIAETDSRFQVQLPYNFITKNISIGQRFIFNDGAWRVTQTDRVSEEGIYSLLLAQDSINAEIDDVEHEIAGAFANKHTYTYDIPTSISIEKDKSINLVYSIKDETGKDFDYSLVTVKNTSNLIQIDNNNEVISIKGLDIGTGSITLSVPSGEVSKDFAINFEVVQNSLNQINYQIKTSNGYTYRPKEGSQISAFKYINGAVDNTLVIDYSLDSSGNNLISKNSINITNKSNTELQIRNININVLTTFTLTIIDKTTGDKILDNQIITLKGM